MSEIIKIDENPYIYLDYPLDQLLNSECKLSGLASASQEEKMPVNSVSSPLVAESGSREGGNPASSELKPPISEDRTQQNYEPGGIILPKYPETPGTGNIVILGSPGSGKSTLALQIAISVVNRNLNQDRFFSAFVALEQPVAHVSNKAAPFGWEKYLHPIRHLQAIEEPPSPEQLGMMLCRILTQPIQHQENCIFFSNQKDKQERKPSHQCVGLHSMDKLKGGCVLLPSLSPRSVAQHDQESDKLFWERYRQIENLLIGAKWLRDDKGRSWLGSAEGRRMLGISDSQEVPSFPELRVVCVDSLNVFGDRPLIREELFRLFDLFRRQEVIGVFIVEDDVSQGGGKETLDIGTIEYLADTVIALTSAEDKGYFIRYLEIKKARYQRHILGKHPFKIVRGATEKEEESEIYPYPKQSGYAIYPSLHYIVNNSKPETNDKRDIQNEEGYYYFGEKNLKYILPDNLIRPGIVTIEGPRGTFKTIIAINFLLEGLIDCETVLLLRLSHDASFNKNIVVSKENDARIKDRETLEPSKLTIDNFSNARLKKATWLYKQGNTNGKLIEIAFKSGTLFPEEFIQQIYHVFIDEASNGGISRVVLDDVSAIGVGYPLLQSSRTAGNLFLPAFVHLMRCWGVDLVMTGTTSELAEANEAVNRAKSLSDAVLACRFCDVFGDRHVIVTGDGLLVGTARPPGDRERELVPGVILLKQRNETSIYKQPFEIDISYLRGLIGFETPPIHRPGLSVYLFKDSILHSGYNKEIRQMLRSAFAAPSQGRLTLKESYRTDVCMEEFDSDGSEAFHDSLGLLSGAPLDRTVVCVLDEFAALDYFNKSIEAMIDLRRPRTTKMIGQDIVKQENNKQNDYDYAKDYIVPLNNKTLHAQPYYANVLLIAYRNRGPNGEDWSDITKTLNLDGNLKPASWEDVYNAARKIVNKSQSTLDAFEYDSSAKETLTCLLMDALIASSAKSLEITPDLQKDSLFSLERSRGDRIREILKGNKKGGGILPEQVKELQYLQMLLHNVRNVVTGQQAPKHENVPKEKALKGSAGMFLCWYSQLRQLIDDNKPLAEQLAVCALPGRGFRGDWYIGVVNGSVSIGLGKEVLGILCSETEEYKRFARGVGLPTLSKFYEPTNDDFFAWPRAHCKLSEVFKIHRQALSRASIHGYSHFRTALAAFCEQLIIGGPDTPERIREIVGRVPARIDFLAGGVP